MKKEGSGKMAESEKVTCVICGGKYQGVVPKGGDGSVLRPRRHRISLPVSYRTRSGGYRWKTEPCRGSNYDALEFSDSILARVSR